MNEIKNVEIADLISAPDNPFKVTMDAEMERLIESIAETGVIAPIIARQTDDGKYEIVSGHRRKYACEYLGMKTVPTIVKELDRNEAVIFLVDSNLQRENILPSEKAFAFKMKLDAISAQGKRTDLTCGQVGHKLRDDISTDESGRQIQRYIRLTYLIPKLLDLVDEGRIALTPAVELSYLSEEQQYSLLDAIEVEDRTPSLSQAIRLKKLNQSGELTDDRITEILREEKANQREMFRMPMERLKTVIPKKYDDKKIEEFVMKACEHYKRYLQKQREQSR